MANIETWCSGGTLRVQVKDPKIERQIVIETIGNKHIGNLRMTVAEAVKLRDDLSRAITEAATVAAKAVEAEGAQA